MKHENEMNKSLRLSEGGDKNELLMSGSCGCAVMLSIQNTVKGQEKKKKPTDSTK